MRTLQQVIEEARARFEAMPKPPPPTEDGLRRQAELDWSTTAAFMGIPLRLVPASFETAKPTEAVEAARMFMGPPFAAGGCLVLSGSTGRGKSWATVCCLRSLGVKGVGDRQYFYFPALCNRLLSPNKRDAALEDAKHSRFVVLDDIGAEYLKVGGLIEGFLDEIIWYREANFRPTIITTNLTPDDMKARFSERIRDRINGDWGRTGGREAAVVVVGGESLRTEP